MPAAQGDAAQKLFRQLLPNLRNMQSPLTKTSALHYYRRYY